MKSWYVYVLACHDGTLYTGYTDNLTKRLQTHGSGKGAKYTRGRLPVTLIFSEQCTTQSQAMRREIAIKKLTRKEKLELIKNGAS